MPPQSAATRRASASHAVPPVAPPATPHVAGPVAWLGRAALAVTAVIAARSAVRARREATSPAAPRDALVSEWSRIPGVAGPRALRIHARVGGAANGLPPAVLVHGYGFGGRHWSAVASTLAARGLVLVPDLPGHGASHQDQRPLRVAELARALAAWMDARGLARAVLVGHGSGCHVIAALADRRPDLAAGLVLVGPPREAGAPVRRRRGAWLGRLSAVVHDAFDSGPDMPPGLADTLRPLDEERLDHVLRRVSAPVRLVRGNGDGLAPHGWLRLLARSAGAPPPVVVAGAGHAVHEDAPEPVARVVLDLVEALSAAGLAGDAAREGARSRPGA
jgi:pimeloyl-ACP methyl ester carboxylesterase